MYRCRAGCTGASVGPSTSGHHLAAVGRMSEPTGEVVINSPVGKLVVDPTVLPNSPASNFRCLATRSASPSSVIYSTTAKGAEKGTEKLVKTTTLTSPASPTTSVTRLTLSFGVGVGTEPSPKLDPSKADGNAPSGVTG